jgi:hypothetical protein
MKLWSYAYEFCMAIEHKYTFKLCMKRFLYGDNYKHGNRAKL